MIRRQSRARCLRLRIFPWIRSPKAEVERRHSLGRKVGEILRSHSWVIPHYPVFSESRFKNSLQALGQGWVVVNGVRCLWMLDLGFLRGSGGVGFRLGDALDGCEHLLANFRFVAAHGETEFGVVRDDVVFRAGLNVSH